MFNNYISIVHIQSFSFHKNHISDWREIRVVMHIGHKVRQTFTFLITCSDKLAMTNPMSSSAPNCGCT
jgi:hypothetical protein